MWRGGRGVEISSIVLFEWGKALIKLPFHLLAGFFHLQFIVLLLPLLFSIDIFMLVVLVTSLTDFLLHFCCLATKLSSSAHPNTITEFSYGKPITYIESRTTI